MSDSRNEHRYHRWAEEFAANHGWLLFHDKVKTSQVYLHDTTLIGNAAARVCSDHEISKGNHPPQISTNLH